MAARLTPVHRALDTPPQPTRFPAHSRVTGISLAGRRASASSVMASSCSTEPRTFMVQVRPTSGTPKWLRMKNSEFGVIQVASVEKSNALLNGEFGDVMNGFGPSCPDPCCRKLRRLAGSSMRLAENCLLVRSIVLKTSDGTSDGAARDGRPYKGPRDRLAFQGWFLPV